MKAVRKHTTCKWVQLYIERWLTAPLQLPNGKLQERGSGVPQGSLIGPVLSNLFLHYVFDAWMQRHYPNTLWCRYADDGLLHCKTEEEARYMLCVLSKRFAACYLELHPDKTKIIYCKDGSRKGRYQHVSFDFLGYTFKPRLVKNSKQNSLFISFTPGVSKASLKAMRATTRKFNWRNRTDLSLQDIARRYNPILRGWLYYYGQYQRSALYPVWRHFNKTLVSWAMRKYKPFRKRKTRAAKFLEAIAEKEPHLFVHWRAGMQGAFA